MISPSLACICTAISIELSQHLSAHIPRVRLDQKDLLQAEYGLINHALREVQIRKLCPRLRIRRREREQPSKLRDSLGDISHRLDQRDPPLLHRLSAISATTPSQLQQPYHVRRV